MIDAQKIGVEKLNIHHTLCGSAFFVVTRKERNMCVEVMNVDNLTDDQIQNQVVKSIAPLLSLIQ